MKEAEITVRVINQDRRAVEERAVTTYTDPRFPGLAIHGPWELDSDEWRVTHIPSGLIVAIVPTRAAATAAMELVSTLHDWNRPQAEVIPAEPGERAWLKANLAIVVQEVKRERAAALKAAVASGTINAAALEAALGDFRCQKMRRAWRTRSNCTHGDWTKQAAKLLWQDAGLEAIWHLAAALYAAASDFSPGGLFAPAAWPPYTWKQLSGRLRTYRAALPEKALSRGQYEAKRRATKKQSA